MALARTLELLKRGEHANDELYRSTTRGDQRHPKPRIERAPDVWSRFLLAGLAAPRPAER